MSYKSWGITGDFQFNATLTAMGHPLCVVVWVKKDATEWAAGGADYAFEFSYDLGVNEYHLLMYTAADSVTTLRGTTSTQNSTKGFTDGTYDDVWVPLFLNYESATAHYTYIEDSTQKGNLTTGNRNLTALDELRIGQFNDTGSAPFQGKIAEISIWDNALAAAEIDLFCPTAGAGTGPIATSIPTATSGANCVAYYPFDYDSDTQTDESGTANGSLVATGTRVYDSDHPIITTAGNPHYYYAQQGY